MLVRIQGTNIELTDDRYALVRAKLDDALRALGRTRRDPVQVDVELEKTPRGHPHEWNTQRRYRAEVTLTVPGQLIRAEGSAETLRQSIVEMKHRLTRELRDWREQVIDARRAGARRAKREPAPERSVDRGDDYEDRYTEEINDFDEEA
jgi:ribosomal subunit interface protein